MAVYIYVYIYIDIKMWKVEGGKGGTNQKKGLLPLWLKPYHDDDNDNDNDNDQTVVCL